MEENDPLAVARAETHNVAELYCQRCNNSRKIIRRGGKNCFDEVPCERCCPEQYATAMTKSAAPAS